jgi:protein-L-isoaspartate(D-aspartate) O-methyltransferase
MKSTARGRGHSQSRSRRSPCGPLLAVSRAALACVLLAIAALGLAAPGCAGGGTQKEGEGAGRPVDPYAASRQAMVDTQIASRGVTDSLVLRAMAKVPRHLFVPESVRSHAYDDTALPIGHGQTISQPYIVAVMTEAIGVRPGQKVFEVGTGSGYQAAVLAEMGVEVYTMEIVEPLAASAAELLKSLGYKAVHVRAGDAYQGWVEHSPFDAVIVTAAPEHVPEPLIEQLKVGGRMVIPVGDQYQDLLLLTKTPDGVEKKSLGPVIFVPMTGEAEDKSGKSDKKDGGD